MTLTLLVILYELQHMVNIIYDTVLTLIVSTVNELVNNQQLETIIKRLHDFVRFLAVFHPP